MRKAPSISGLSKEGELITVDNGLWGGFPAPTLSYTWQRCNATNVCSIISSATTSTYRVTYEDAGNSIKAIVKATNSVGSVSVTTNAISGIIVIGGMLFVSGSNPWIAGVAIFLATINIAGGFLVTHRMLKMFRKE